MSDFAADAYAAAAMEPVDDGAEHDADRDAEHDDDDEHEPVDLDAEQDEETGQYLMQGQDRQDQLRGHDDTEWERPRFPVDPELCDFDKLTVTLPYFAVSFFFGPFANLCAAPEKLEKGYEKTRVCIVKNGATLRCWIEEEYVDPVLDFLNGRRVMDHKDRVLIRRHKNPSGVPGFLEHANTCSTAALVTAVGFGRCVHAS